MCLFFFLVWIEYIIPEKALNPKNLFIMRETMPGVMMPLRCVALPNKH